MDIVGYRCLNKMAQSRVVTVNYNSNRHCFVSLPENFVRDVLKKKGTGFETADNINNVLVVSLTTTTSESVAFMSSAGGEFNRRSDTIAINGWYAGKLNLSNGDRVVLNPVLDAVERCQRAFMEPVSIDDWEILELHAQFAEEHILDQVRVIWQGQIIPIWVSDYTCVYVKIGEMSPSAKCTILMPNTQILIAPKDRWPPGGETDNYVSPKPDLIPDNEAYPSQTDSSDPYGRLTTTNSSDESEDSDDDRRPSLFRRGLNYVRDFYFGTAETKNSRDEFGELSNRPIRLRRRVQHVGDLSRAVFEHAQNRRVLRNLATGRRTPRLLRNSAASNRYVDYPSLQPTTVFIDDATVVDGDDDFSPDSFVARLTKIPSPNEIEKREADKKVRKSVSKSENIDVSLSGGDRFDCCIIRVKRVRPGSMTDDILRSAGNFDPSLKNRVLVSPTLRRRLRLEVASRVEIESVHYLPTPVIESVVLHLVKPLSLEFNIEMVKIAFTYWILSCCSEKCPLVVANGTFISLPLGPDSEVDVIIEPEFKKDDPSSDDVNTAPTSNQSYGLLHPKLLKNLAINVSVESLGYSLADSVDELDNKVEGLDLVSLGGVDGYVKRIVQFLESGLLIKPIANELLSRTPGVASGCLLVCGARGVGKSTLTRAVCKSLNESPSAVNVKVIECKQLKGKRIDTIAKIFHKTFIESSWRQPSVILFDDIDHLVAAPVGPEQEIGPQAVYNARIAEVIKDLFVECSTSKRQIVVIATCVTSSAIHETLASCQGWHFFPEIIEMTVPNKRERLNILSTLIKRHPSVNPELIDSLNTEDICDKTEGFVARDIKRLLDRALHTHLRQPGGADCDCCKPDAHVISTEEFNVAVEGFKPLSLRNVPLHTAGELGWADIGGLENVRKSLVETLLWPSKYPLLFSNCVLRVRSGILLYGPPGTGKTLLAGIIAKECQLNFISIKGPELLSKYIGASEQAVRDLFTRAQSAKPCILFFDEFDSLAPRRGHDSTGVTDRVVNQILTQLDGVEGLDGVYVLAATSRPDLIDPALLRPGRLDKSLYCSMPSQEERVEILKALTRRMKLSNDVDVDEIARRCQHFSGADLKALLYNAQLDAIHRSMDDHQLRESDNREIDDRTHEATDDDEDDVLYVANAVEGIVEISRDEKDTILNQVKRTMFRDKKTDFSHGDAMKESVSSGAAVSMANIENALSDTRPSVTPSERMRYQMIYDKFVGSRGGTFTSETTTQRATLS
ncbi:peroxisomal ATPase PEX1-like [Tubulanus polymorphus]|uniref:peroxisomal ATPase PEX1-like n=1 Tax=Tubulanus polymorphus TaxID=672921 RepID=UPI003DA333A3